MSVLEKLQNFEKVAEEIKNTFSRDHIKDSNFVFPPDKEHPHGRYPIHDIEHARNALARVAQHGTPEEKAKVRAAVCHKYPSIESCKK